jgi:redox-sensitive bicupin YhaK (pirin superfamily)
METFLLRAASRGHVESGWLNTWHSFSFAHYYNPERMGYGALRVINDDTIAPGAGFDEHFHDNMEIVTIPLSGALEHKDSLGNKGQITAGEVQHMSAGHGILHAEYNASQTEPVSLFQIWLLPNERQIKPSYSQKRIDLESKPNQFVDLELPLHQAATFYLGRFDQDTETALSVRSADHGLFVMVIEGKAEAAGEILEKRDALGVSDIKELPITAKAGSFILIMEIPMLNQAET